MTQHTQRAEAIEVEYALARFLTNRMALAARQEPQPAPSIAELVSPATPKSVAAAGMERLHLLQILRGTRLNEWTLDDFEWAIKQLSARLPGVDPASVPVVGNPLEYLRETQASPKSRQRENQTKRAYEQYLMERIEGYKHSLSRSELMRLAADATNEMAHEYAGQLVLTETLVLEAVDNEIRRRLKLPSYARWKSHQKSVRIRQQDLSRWGLGPSPEVDVALTLEAEQTLVISPLAWGVVPFLAARDNYVCVLSPDLVKVEELELLLASEGLGHQVEAYVTNTDLQPGMWMPMLDKLVAAAFVGSVDWRELSEATIGQLILESALESTHVFTSAKPIGKADRSRITSIYHEWDCSVSRRSEISYFVARRAHSGKS